MERVPKDVWESGIYRYLSDKDIIATNGLSKSLRKNLDKNDIYTRRFYDEWVVFGEFDVFEFDLNCITRDDYFKICKQYQQWSNDENFTGATNICLTKPYIGWEVFRNDLYENNSDYFQISFIPVNYKQQKCVFCGTCHSLKNIQRDLPTFFPKKLYEKLYEERISKQRKPYQTRPFQFDFMNLYPPIIANNYLTQTLGRLNRARNHIRQIHINYARRDVIEPITPNKKRYIGFSSIFPLNSIEFKLARKYVRMRYLERYGTIVLYKPVKRYVKLRKHGHDRRLCNNYIHSHPVHLT